MQFFQVNVDSLHKSLVDSELGFKDCASITKNDVWKQKFECFASKRLQMMRDLEIYGGASKTVTGTMKGGLSRAWLDIKSSISGGGQNIADSICKEEMSLKKAYENALKSYGIASSLNGLLMDHMKKIDCDMKELHSMFGTEMKMTDTAVNTTEQPPAIQRKQSIGDKIKSTFGIGGTTEQQQMMTTEKQQLGTI
jgi:uncharacterized protein (TIGR02284 family)